MKEKGFSKESEEDEGEPLEPGEGKKETLVDVICRNIRRDIIMGILQPGMKIMSRDLAERYGTSETPVKLALNRMISEQVVENYPRQGMIIKPVTLSDAEEIFALRLMMDLYYTKEIIDAVQVNKSLKQELANNIKEHEEVMHQYISSNDVELFVQDYNHDYEFHRLYLKCSGNQKLVDMYKGLNPFIYSNYIFRQQSQEKDMAGLEEHKAILNAIVIGDEELLKQSIRTHINNAINSIRIIMKCERIH
ncbi:MAG: GntR family transcriptional regulator [Clostridium sp.]